MFQKSVIDKYLKEMDKNLIKSSYERFKAVFCHSETILNIEASKEEQYQEGFLIDLFVHSLGYTINPNPLFNLTTEYKNIADNRKADGAIIKDGKPIGVIELKGTDTVDLKKVEKQGFEYRYAHPTCKYVITSNFRELRLYVDTSESYEEFTLFNMEYPDFERLYLLLAKNNIYEDKPLKIKNDSKLKEEDISDKLYKDYHRFKMNIFNSMVKNNPSINKVELLKKSQKLLDRILFIFFAEDRGLLPPNTISTIISENKEQANIGREEPLYNTYKIYFKHIDKGNSMLGISEYNGGLFAPDELLDNLIIEDAVLKEDALKISSYDFSTDIDVNILGHIFENSLNDIDEMHAEVTGAEFDKSKTKRKKDGVFYTPSYITKYIVENTIGVLCEEKKKELGLIDITLDTSKDYKRLSKDKQSLLDNLYKYREYISSLKILDPACGSGAFLNQALEYLIEEHRFIDLYRRPLEGDALGYYDVRSSILENNLYGVDINEESVELARLSLWLRTAERGRKLNDLSKNIKCGNSLIDDESIAGELAFNWKEKFSEIMANGGFDVVIGNPPYVNINTMPEIHEYLKNKYSEIHTGYNDLMYYFLFKGIDILKESGIYGVITSNYFLGNDYADKLRLFLNKHLEIIVNFEKTLIFNDANVHTTLVFAKKNTRNHLMKFYTYAVNKPLLMVDLSFGYTFCELERSNQSEKWLIADNQNQKIINKLHSNSKFIGEICQIAKGSESGKNEVFTITLEDVKNYNIENSVLRKCVKNSDVLRYYLNETDSYLIYADNNFSKILFPNAFKYLELHKDILLDRRGPKTNEYEWWRLHRPSIKEIFDSNEKLLVPYRATRNRFAYDNQQFFNNGGDIRCLVVKENIEISLKYILVLLNSKLLNWFYGFIGKSKGDSREYFNKPLSEIPITNLLPNEQEPFIKLADSMLKLTTEIKQKRQKFVKRLSDNLNLDKINSGIENFEENDFKHLLKELSKLKIIMTLSQQDEWEEYFNIYKKEINQLQLTLENTDLAIDKMVYDLYGLTMEERDIIEKAI